MASAPDTLSLKRNRDLVGRGTYTWVRRVALVLLTVVLGLALLNTFGQRPEATSVTVDAGKLTVYAPTHVRSGLIYAARFRIDANREIVHPTLVLSSGWTEGYTFNGTAPQPVSESNRNGRIVFTFGRLPAGQHLSFYASLQVNPTNVGRRTADVELDDGSTELLTVYRTITIFP